jgi:ubiquinone/menaquinone biosynthesis C-methylase UbiE
MSELVSQEEIAVATAYEELFVPALFQQWAPRVADVAQIQPGQRALDVACGTGVLARQAAARVGPTGFVAGLDLNPGMLAVAEQLAPAVEWRQGAAESLPYADNAFDAVVSQFGLMFFRDPIQSLREMWRVLAPGGRLAVAVWDRIENTPAYARWAALLERLAGKEAADAVRLPFALGDRDELAALFAAAGVASAEINTYPGVARFPTVHVMVEADLRGWLPVMGVFLSEEQIAGILVAAEQELGRFVNGGEQMVFACSAHIVTATKS